MKLSIHQDIRGKPVKVEALSGDTWMECHGRRVSLGYGWINIETDWPVVFELITKDGIATSAELASDNRRDSEFVSRELFMVDIDNGMNIEELFDNDFYNQYGAGFYTTPSHTDQAHRFRMMFRTETPIYNNQLAKYILMALMRQFNHADIACKDSTRIFYGTVDCPIFEIRDNILSDAQVAELVAKEIEIEQTSRPLLKQDNRQFEPKTLAQVEQLLDELRKHYADLEYSIRRDVTWAVASTCAHADTVSIMRARWPDHDKTMKYEGFVNDLKNPSITLGTVYHLIRKHDPNYAKNTEKMLHKEPIPSKIDTENGLKIYEGSQALQIARKQRNNLRNLIRNS